MSKVIQRINISNNPKAQSLKYFLTVMTTFWITSIIISKNIPFSIYISIVTVCLCVIILYFLYKKDKVTKKTIELTEEGVLETNYKGKTFIKWEENHQIYYDGAEFTFSGIIPIGSYSSTQIVTRTKRIKIDSQNNTFHHNIISLSHKHVFTSLSHKVHNGERVNFGKIALDKNYIYIKNREYGREDIQKFKVTEGKLQIKLSKDWFKSQIHVYDIANITTLIQIINGPSQ
jgi:Ca2+/Na+ antiporter